MMKFGPILGILLSTLVTAKDCGPVPPGITFGPQCEMIPVPPPIPAGKLEEGWELVEVGSFSGKPGYFVKVGTHFQQQLTAVVMNDGAASELSRSLERAVIGKTKICQVKGLQQSIGYTVFKVRKCR